MSMLLEKEQSFLSELDNAPNDLDLRSIFADWLDEQEDPRADLTRQLTRFAAEEIDAIDTSNCELLMRTLRAFAPPQKSLTAWSNFQRRIMPVWRDMWIDIGRSSEPANRAAAEQAVRRMAAQASLAEPARIQWFDSPRAAALEASTRPDQSLSMAWEKLRDHIWIPIQGYARENLPPYLITELEDNIEMPVMARVWSDAGVSVRWGVFDSAGGDIRDTLSYQCHVGQFDAEWAAEYSFLRSVCGLQFPVDPLSDLQLTLNAGWCWFTDGGALLSDRPIQITIQDGLVTRVLYRDGFETTPDF